MEPYVVDCFGELGVVHRLVKLQVECYGQQLEQQEALCDEYDQELPLLL